MHTLVKITHNEDGDKMDRPPWCFSVVRSGSPMAMCSMQVYGYGEGSAKYETKQAERGGITCPQCLAEIKEIKAIRL